MPQAGKNLLIEINTFEVNVRLEIVFVDGVANEGTTRIAPLSHEDNLQIDGWVTHMGSFYVAGMILDTV